MFSHLIAWLVILAAGIVLFVVASIIGTCLDRMGGPDEQDKAVAAAGTNRRHIS